jgi:hypothetical protein
MQCFHVGVLVIAPALRGAFDGPTLQWYCRILPQSQALSWCDRERIKQKPQPAFSAEEASVGHL